MRDPWWLTVFYVALAVFCAYAAFRLLYYG
jgi:hypothetical protein